MFEFTTIITILQKNTQTNPTQKHDTRFEQRYQIPSATNRTGGWA